MKYGIAVLTALILTVSLAACGTQPATAPEAEPTAVSDGSMAQLANPWVELTKAEWEQKVGITLGSPACDDKPLYRFCASEQLGEVQFTVNGAEWNARVKPGAALEDISGLAYHWDSEEPSAVLGAGGTVSRWQGDGQVTVLYQNYRAAEKRTYSLSCIAPTEPDPAAAAVIFAP